MTEGNNDNNDIRQVTLVSLNESVNLLSSYKNEDMDFLVAKAVSLMEKIKNGNKK